MFELRLEELARRTGSSATKHKRKERKSICIHKVPQLHPRQQPILHHHHRIHNSGRIHIRGIASCAKMFLISDMFAAVLLAALAVLNPGLVSRGPKCAAGRLRQGMMSVRERENKGRARCMERSFGEERLGVGIRGCGVDAC